MTFKVNDNKTFKLNKRYCATWNPWEELQWCSKSKSSSIQLAKNTSQKVNFSKYRKPKFHDLNLENAARPLWTDASEPRRACVHSALGQTTCCNARVHSATQLHKSSPRLAGIRLPNSKFQSPNTKFQIQNSKKEHHKNPETTFLFQNPHLKTLRLHTFKTLAKCSENWLKQVL